MKKIKLLLLLLALTGAAAYSQIQQIKIVSFTVKNQLPSVIDNWNNVPGSLLLVAQLPPTIRVKGIKLIVQIKAGGAIVCSNNSTGGMQVDEFTTRTFSANELTGSLQGCHDLKDGSYSICVQFYNVDRVAISNEVCKEFSVETPKPTDFAPPTLITPENGKGFTEAELQRPVMFRWTSLVPKPKEPVTYRLKVWQLMQGQNGTQAMRTNQPIVTKDVENITQAVVSGLYTGPCKPPYLCDFIWNVQGLNREGKPMGRNEGTSEPYTFTVKNSGEVPSGNIKPPVNTFPEDKKSISLDDAKRSINFKWKPVEPKQADGITYKLKVWQLMQGQNGQQAMKSNKPIVTKEVNNNTEVLVAGIITGPCKPPYMCDFIWEVQAVNREGKPVGENNGTSQPTMFAVTQYIIQLDSIKVSCTSKPGVYSFSYTITNPNAGPATLNLFTVTSSVPAGATIGTFTPPINTVINAGNQLTITGTINAATNLSNICIGAEIRDVGNTFWKASKDTCVKVTPCKCEACDEKNFSFKAPTPQSITISNNTIAFNQPITITTTPAKTITAIKAELVYFEMVPENDMCIPCNKDAATYGHFTNGSNSQEWNGPQQTLNINITTPQLTPCCSAVFKWCIRYKVEFKDCTTCNVLICYEKKKEGCIPDNPNIKSAQK